MKTMVSFSTKRAFWSGRANSPAPLSHNGLQLLFMCGKDCWRGVSGLFSSSETEESEVEDEDADMPEGQKRSETVVSVSLPNEDAEMEELILLMLMLIEDVFRL